VKTMKRVPKQRKRGRSRRIPPQERPKILPFKNNDVPVFSFLHCDPLKYTVREWNLSELRELFRFFGKVENQTWTQIMLSGRSGGLGYTPVSRKSLPALPNKIPEDATIFELRVCEKKRVFAHRFGDICHLIWFDREHRVCPS